MHYVLFGLRVRVSCRLPGLMAVPSFPAQEAQVCICLGSSVDFPPVCDTSQLWYQSSPQRGNPPLLTIWQHTDPAAFYFRYGDGTEFLVDASGQWIRGQWPPTLTLEDLTTYLLGPIFGFVLRLRGAISLHASVIALDDRAVALVGPARAGKSTTAAAFARQGYGILTDDVAPVFARDGRWYVQPSYPHIRLWPDSAQALFTASPTVLAPLTPNWDKRYLDLTQPAHRFFAQPLPLAGVYFLQKRLPELATPRIEAIGRREGLLALVANVYATYLLNKTNRAHELGVLHRLGSQVPLRRLTPPADLAKLPGLCDAILLDAATIPASSGH